MLVDHQRWLPDGWVPPDLVEPNVPFNFAGLHKKRLFHREAAVALEDLIQAAARDGVACGDVSGYRSERTPADVWDVARARGGEAAAARAVAQPGHSEHQTGLAIDITDNTGSCLLNPCFAGTPAGRRADANAPRFGDLVRYPLDAESIAGYEGPSDFSGV